MEALLRDRPFYENSGGGLSVSGGEPFLQRGFLMAALEASRGAGLSTAVETALQVPREALLEALPLTDLFLADFKHPRRGPLRETVGADLDRVADNLALLVREGAKLQVRIPVIPGFNDSPEIMEEARGFLAALGIPRAELVPFHNLGGPKYRALGRDYPYAGAAPPSPEALEKLRGLFT
jgi:pyruvate formate lyase activating enzyme